MPELMDGESVQVRGSGSSTYTLKNTGGVLSCSCPAWRNQSQPIERRTCKHLKAWVGEEAERVRVGSAEAPPPRTVGAGDDQGPPVLLAERWENDVDLAGWWMSEKLDGVRAWWDGRNLISRLGNVFVAPDWFVEHLPQETLDGELWCARKAFQRTSGIVRRQDRSDLWKEVTYVVFDAPKVAEPFEGRMAWLGAHLAGPRPYARVHEHHRCQGLTHLRQELARVQDLGGEGLMLRRPGSLYEAGRSSSLLKVKTFHEAEARVLDHLAGAGRHKGRLGALLVEMADGTRFSVGTGFSDAEREAPPPVGSLITYRYQELSDGGVPRFPSFIGVRGDVARPTPTVAVAPPVVGTPPEPASSASFRAHLECVEGTSSKFWEIQVAQATTTVRFGRIGSRGTEKVTVFASPGDALKEAEKLVREKRAKGYGDA